ncbi:carboxymethylenebutenolidase [Colletotrichum tofieldiae]|uniref:Carboxymethylenebutenolidase n=1 Tax=Colletotrichum tofieldiae TaxID=708197 RepID=A0A166V9H3_9PEZI|nr:carboxymethylenebutenolidase [Colletotrichum tofieldiae]GKT53865.1 carboxymethylenebutenolidase [Colletotrichum tofieldiae]GKT73605.1 carboxymethylenebutenolidase [Colletotrichum tofieldiae]GKT95552.1 carboxymethylenebutenolidase [Colletotrichum tofieldiae]
MAAITIQRPLSRRGHGPGLLILVEQGIDLSKHDEILDPPPAQKWAEEGYAVAQLVVTPGASDVADQVSSAIKSLRELDSCDDKERFGVIAHLTASSQQVADALEKCSEIRAAVFFNFGQALAIPTLSHLPGTQAEAPKAVPTAKRHSYPAARDFFIIPSHPNFNANAAGLAHTRTLTFLKPILGGPYFDLEAVWEEHTLFEFGERNVEKTMATMVEQPYVNHIPTLTGGVGRGRLTNFYRDHFIFNNPDDTELELVSRTVGIDRVIDEFVFKCTHDKVIDWLLPGVPPTGKHLSIPFTSVVNVRGDLLHHEHIAWDQATALRQLGLLPEYLPFPYQINGSGPANGKKFEFKLPVAGVESAHKLVDESAVESNAMFEYGTREVDA